MTPIENAARCTPGCVACSTLRVEIDAALDRLDILERRLEAWFAGVPNARRPVPEPVPRALSPVPIPSGIVPARAPS